MVNRNPIPETIPKITIKGSINYKPSPNGKFLIGLPTLVASSFCSLRWHVRDITRHLKFRMLPHTSHFSSTLPPKKRRTSSIEDRPLKWTQLLYLLAKFLREDQKKVASDWACFGYESTGSTQKSGFEWRLLLLLYKWSILWAPWSLGTPLTHSHFLHPCHPPRRSVWSNQLPQLSLAADWKARTPDTFCVPCSFLTDWSTIDKLVFLEDIGSSNSTLNNKYPLSVVVTTMDLGEKNFNR